MKHSSQRLAKRNYSRERLKRHSSEREQLCRPEGNHSGSPIGVDRRPQPLSGVFTKKTPHCTPFKTSRELENRRKNPRKAQPTSTSPYRRCHFSLRHARMVARSASVASAPLLFAKRAASCLASS